MPSPPGLAAITLALALLGGAQPAMAQAPGSPQLPVEPAATLPLEGTTWRLREFIWRGTQRTVGPEVAAWMTLRAGSLRGSGGCDRLRGRYGRMGDVIRVRSLGAPATTCAEQTVLVEQAMIEGLRKASRFSIVSSEARLGAELVLRDQEGTETLRFMVDDVGSLTAESWLLTSWTVGGRTQPASTSQAAVLAFEADGGSRLRRQWEGNVVGSSGCNGIVGIYARDADLLRFRDLETTAAPCPSDLAAQEAAMLALLGSSAVQLDLPPDRLVLTSSETGDRLDFVTSTPLEGSTWLLSAVRGQADADTPVTLRLEGGLVTGEGPCSSYSGSYVSDGIFISISDLHHARAMDCPARTQQRALLQALERALLLDRDQPQLRLLDPAGSVVARFKRPTGP